MCALRRLLISGGLAAICAAAVIAIAAPLASAKSKLPTCPKETTAQMKALTGFGLGQESSSIHSTEITCFYFANPNDAPSITMKVFKGAATYASTKATIDENLGTIDSEGDQSGTPCSASFGQCDGSTYNAHESPYSGLGVKGLDFPGCYGGGAMVMFIDNGDTFLVQSDGPYEQRGPSLSGVLAFARHLLAIHYTL